MSDPTSSLPALSPTIFGVHGEALMLRQQRLQLIASNLANADTPGYQARDIDFASALREATQTRTVSASDGSAVTNMSVDANKRRFEVYRVPTQPSLDGNTVDAQQEEASFARAAVEYRATLSFVESRLRTLSTAITGE